MSNEVSPRLSHAPVLSPEPCTLSKVNEGPESTTSAEAEGNVLCQTQNPLHSPHQGFWTLVLKLLGQYTEAMTGRPALQQSC